MKRTPLRSGKPLKRGKPLARRTPIKARNAKRADQRAADYAKYLAGPVWRAKRKEALERAGHRCESTVMIPFDGVTYPTRCAEWQRLQVHHTRYPRTLGTESIDTLLVVCKAHHDYLTATTQWWKRI